MGLSRTGALAFLASAHAQVRRLRIVNGCDQHPIWIAHTAGATPGPDAQDLRIDPLQHYDFSTPDNLFATRFWPKVGCDAQGGHCTVGDSGGPGEACVQGGYDYSQCAPPVDTKFEASFGINGQPCDPSFPGGSKLLGCDHIDLSLVDGFTLPVKLTIDGDCNSSTPEGGRIEEIDCSGLTADVCPRAEHLTEGRVVDLAAVNPSTQKMGGCYSPCSRLLDTKWVHHEGGDAEDPKIAPYCCPTPPISPEACRTGPIAATDYLKVLEQKCPNAYSYAYDDATGLLRCSSSSKYTLTYYCFEATASQADGANKARSTPPPAAEIELVV